MPGLMWVDCTEQKPEKRWEAAALARQHVMLRYLAKQSATTAKPPGKQQISTHPSENGILPDEADAQTRLKASRQRQGTTGPRARAKHSRLQGCTNAPAETGLQLAVPRTPAAALTFEKDRIVYQAAWWHCYRPDVTRKGDWIGSCRHAWNVGFWEFAKTDETLREIFLSFAAAKEAAVRLSCGSDPDTIRLHSRAYLNHKGNAIQLVSKDIKAEGHAARVAVLATVCLLCKTAFVEGEYDVAEAHLRGIVILVSYRMHEIPSFLWLFAIWADLRLTGVSTRAPALPYGIHPDFAKSSLPTEIMDQAKLLATCNVLSLPTDDVVTEQALLSLLQHMHAMVILFNDAADYGTNWEAPWNTIYDVAYALASLRARLGEADGNDTRPLRLFLHAASIQFWSTTRKFVPFGGCHDYSLEQISQELSQLSPEALSDGWHAAGGANNALLWSLANTCAAYLRQFLAKGDTPGMMPQWLRKCTNHVLKGMAITTYKSFFNALREMPFTENWTAAMAHPVFVWLTSEGEQLHVIVQGKKCALDSKEMSLFADLRLTFDDEIAVCTNSWLVVGPLEDHLSSGGRAAPPDSWTQKLPVRRNGDGHSFRCQLTNDPSVALSVHGPGGQHHAVQSALRSHRASKKWVPCAQTPADLDSFHGVRSLHACRDR